MTPPEGGSRARLLHWALHGRYRALAVAVALGIIGSVAEALLPIGVGHVLDTVLAPARRDLLVAVGLLGALVAVVIGATVTRFALSQRIRIHSTCRIGELIGHHVARSTGALHREVAAGEVATAVAADAAAIGSLPDSVALFLGAVTAYGVVACYLLSHSVALGLLVLVGIPLLVFGMSRVVRPLEQRRGRHRELLGELTVLGVDLARGLKVLRGLGAEATVLARYRRLSGEVRQAGVRVAGTHAALEAGQVLLPGIFLVVVTWLGARLALSGRFSPGELVALYGTAAFLVQPISAMAGLASRLSGATVGADRVLAILGVTRPRTFDGTVEDTAPPAGPGLRDPISGVRADAGQLTVVATTDPESVRGVAGRLAGLPDDSDDSGVLGELGGTPMTRLREGDVRARIVLNDSCPYLFSGPLNTVLDPFGTSTGDQLWAAVRAACAEEIVTGLPDGLDTVLDEGGRSLSGGQRQRVALARALVADPEHLVLVDPTSALDATTETEVAARLREHRRGRTTVVFSTSPPLVEVADRVVFLGDTVGDFHEGTHQSLVERVPGYRDLVRQGVG